MAMVSFIDVLKFSPTSVLMVHSYKSVTTTKMSSYIHFLHRINFVIFHIGWTIINYLFRSSKSFDVIYCHSICNDLSEVNLELTNFVIKLFNSSSLGC